jgi:hypothetical protein
MAKVKNHGPSIKDDRRYEALRDKGYSKEKAARIANTPAHQAGVKGGHAEQYENRTKKELYQKAKEIGIEGRSGMNKQEIIHALRNH